MQSGDGSVAPAAVIGDVVALPEPEWSGGAVEQWRAAQGPPFLGQLNELWRQRVAFARPRGAARAGRSQGGFTLLELIIVIAVIGILATIALPNLRQVPRRAQEAVLKTNLRTLRDAIDQYYADKGYYPASLEALVEEEYLRGLPLDPMTKSHDTWVEVRAEYDEEAAETDYGEEGEPGVEDVHSGSDLVSVDGLSKYSEW